MTKPQRSSKVSRELIRKQLAAFPLFASCSLAALQGLAQHTERRELRGGELLLRESAASSHVFALTEGSVRVFYSHEGGEELTVKLFHAPAFFGEMEALVDIPHLESVEALVRSVVLAVPRTPFVAFLRQSPEVTFQLLVDVSARLCIAAKHERNLAFRDVPSRLASLLLSYGRLFGVPVQGGLQLGRAFTYEDLANDLGVTEKSVQRAIGDWSRQGWLRRSSRTLVLQDLQAFARLAGELNAQIDHQLATTAETNR